MQRILIFVQPKHQRKYKGQFALATSLFEEAERIYGDFNSNPAQGNGDDEISIDSASYAALRVDCASLEAQLNDEQYRNPEQLSAEQREKVQVLRKKLEECLLARIEVCEKQEKALLSTRNREIEPYTTQSFVIFFKYRDDARLLAAYDRLLAKDPGIARVIRVMHIPDGISWDIREHGGSIECIEERQRRWAFCIAQQVDEIDTIDYYDGENGYLFTEEEYMAQLSVQS